MVLPLTVRISHQAYVDLHSAECSSGTLCRSQKFSFWAALASPVFCFLSIQTLTFIASTPGSLPVCTRSPLLALGLRNFPPRQKDEAIIGPTSFRYPLSWITALNCLRSSVLKTTILYMLSILFVCFRWESKMNSCYFILVRSRSLSTNTINHRTKTKTNVGIRVAKQNMEGICSDHNCRGKSKRSLGGRVDSPIALPVIADSLQILLKADRSNNRGYAKYLKSILGPASVEQWLSISL